MDSTYICTGGRGWGAFGRDTGGIENRQPRNWQPRWARNCIGGHGRQAAGAFGLIRPGTLGVDYPGVAWSMLYAWLYVAHMWETLRPYAYSRVSPACIPYAFHEFPIRHTGAQATVCNEYVFHDVFVHVSVNPSHWRMVRLSREVLGSRTSKGVLTMVLTPHQHPTYVLVRTT